MPNKTCPRCGATFLCNHENIRRCQCAKVVLSAEAQRYIQTHYADCLCCRCLMEINALYSRPPR